MMERGHGKASTGKPRIACTNWWMKCMGLMPLANSRRGRTTCVTIRRNNGPKLGPNRPKLSRNRLQNLRFHSLFASGALGMWKSLYEHLIAADGRDVVRPPEDKINAALDRAEAEIKIRFPAGY